MHNPQLEDGFTETATCPSCGYTDEFEFRCCGCCSIVAAECQNCRAEIGREISDGEIVLTAR